MKKPDYVYVTYIATTPEKVWEAMVNTEITRHWWMDPKAGCQRVNVSDWKPGSVWEHTRADGTGTVDILGRVEEVQPPSRLVMSWARPQDFDNPAGHSRLTIDIEPYSDGLVRLTITHDGLDADMLNGISGGWPKVLSNLKTYLETGHALPATPAEHA